MLRFFFAACFITWTSQRSRQTEDITPSSRLRRPTSLSTGEYCVCHVLTVMISWHWPPGTWRAPWSVTPAMRSGWPPGTPRASPPPPPACSARSAPPRRGQRPGPPWWCSASALVSTPRTSPSRKTSGENRQKWPNLIQEWFFSQSLLVNHLCVVFFCPWFSMDLVRAYEKRTAFRY